MIVGTNVERRAAEAAESASVELDQAKEDVLKGLACLQDAVEAMLGPDWKSCMYEWTIDTDAFGKAHAASCKEGTICM